MKSVANDQIPEAERQSPKGAYHLFQKNISLALGGKKDVGLWGGGHPFDLAAVRLPSGCKNWPAHRHSAQWELYYILEGTGRYFDGESWNALRVGDAVLSPPGEVHQIENPGSQDLIYLVIADMPQTERTTYPASGRTFAKPERKFLDTITADYYDGHE